MMLMRFLLVALFATVFPFAQAVACIMPQMAPQEPIAMPCPHGGGTMMMAPTEASAETTCTVAECYNITALAPSADAAKILTALPVVLPPVIQVYEPAFTPAPLPLAYVRPPPERALNFADMLRISGRILA